MAAIGGIPGAFLTTRPMPVVARIESGREWNQYVKHNGHRYRVCTYRTVTGWSSFVESSRFLEGCAGHQVSARAAWLAALRIVAGVTS